MLQLASTILQLYCISISSDNIFKKQIENIQVKSIIDTELSLIYEMNTIKRPVV
jgi:hypothetical protein